MGLLDNMKARLGPAKERVAHLAQRHEGSIEHGLVKAAKLVDEKTRGKYSDKIHAGTGKAKGAVHRLAHKDGPAPHGGTAPGGAAPPTPPQGPPPTS
ncbi:antitoxin [Streptomyces sp. NPDC020801]|uniref:antitoxin n=1 Tax=unclassified Streptomyces TaxID=2593676 RepID=UPI00378B4C17